MSVLFGDTFVDTNGVLLPAHTPTGPNPALSWARGFFTAGDLQIQANGMAGSTSTGFVDTHALLAQSGSWPADVSIAFDFHTVTNINHFPAVTARHSTTSDACYYAQYDRGTGQWAIGIVNAANPNGFTDLVTAAYPVPADGTVDHMVFEVQGNALRLYKNGSLFLSTTDNTISAAGKPGLYDVTGTVLTATTGFHIENMVVSDTMVGGATVVPQRGCLTMIADRMAKALMIASAVHTVVGRHELRGAAQRTKVALPTVVDVQIKPPPSRTGTLPYRMQGAPQRKPRLSPTSALTRKPLPITKSVQLPHLLKGAAQRKPWPLPAVTAARTPPPPARATVGKHAFPIVVAPVRVVADPIIAAFRLPPPKVRSFVARSQAMGEERGPFPQPVIVDWRRPLPRVRSVVLRAAIQHPTTGSAAPIVSMLEMDAPTTRSFVAHRTQLVPVPPAPSRPDPTTALVRTPRIVVETFVGVPRPRIVVTAPAAPRPDPTVALVRTPLPKVTSWGGPSGRWFLAAHQQWAEPIVTLVRAPLARVKSFVGSLRPKLSQPAISRPRPRVVAVRITPPKMWTDAGSGIAHGPAGIQLAIAVSDGTIPLRPEINGSIMLTTSE